MDRDKENIAFPKFILEYLSRKLKEGVDSTSCSYFIYGANHVTLTAIVELAYLTSLIIEKVGENFDPDDEIHLINSNIINRTPSEHTRLLVQPFVHYRLVSAHNSQLFTELRKSIIFAV